MTPIRELCCAGGTPSIWILLITFSISIRKHWRKLLRNANATTAREGSHTVAGELLGLDCHTVNEICKLLIPHCPEYLINRTLPGLVAQISTRPVLVYLVSKPLSSANPLRYRAPLHLSRSQSLYPVFSPAPTNLKSGDMKCARSGDMRWARSSLSP